MINTESSRYQAIVPSRYRESPPEKPAAPAESTMEYQEPRDALSLSHEAEVLQRSPGEFPGAGTASWFLQAPATPAQPEAGADTAPCRAHLPAMAPSAALLSMTLGGTLGLNGVTTGQESWPGGGSIQSSQEYEDLIGSFSQGSRGNCASVATIKAAMDTYGDQVFEDVQENPDGSCQVTMKDGVTVDISAREMKIAEKMADFEGMEGDEYDEAVLCYASMAKRAQMENNDGSRTYIGACRSLNNGEWPDDTARFLGLEDCMIPVDPDALQGTSYDSLVVWSGDHCVYVNNEDGSYMEDHYGEEYAYDGSDTVGNDLEGAYTFA